jgi:hypothetical protein
MNTPKKNSFVAHQHYVWLLSTLIDCYLINAPPDRRQKSIVDAIIEKNPAASRQQLLRIIVNHLNN